MNTLFLRLEGPLQSWGVRSRWGERDTMDEPTKSGVIGLLGCASGMRRNDDRLRVLSNELRMGVRVDRPGIRLDDYHTTGGAKADDGEPEGMLKSDGKRKRETDVSTRGYLADASFLVALQGPEATIARLSEVLLAPVWPFFLGRKSCPPAVPVFTHDDVGHYEDLESALKSWPPGSDAVLPLRLLIEVRPGEGTRQNDNVGHPGRRVFRPRFVAEQFWWPTVCQDEKPINTFE